MSTGSSSTMPSPSASSRVGSVPSGPHVVTAARTSPSMAPDDKDVLFSHLDSLQEHWDKYDHRSLRQKWDSFGLEIAHVRTRSKDGRKGVVSRTREFREREKASSGKTRPSVGPLLKEYQTFIDTLTKRAEAAERQFLDVYNVMRDVPDPRSLIADLKQFVLAEVLRREEGMRRAGLRLRMLEDEVVQLRELGGHKDSGAEDDIDVDDDDGDGEVGPGGDVPDEDDSQDGSKDAEGDGSISGPGVTSVVDGDAKTIVVLRESLADARQELKKRMGQLSQSEDRCGALQAQLGTFQTQLEILQSDLHSAIVEKEQLQKSQHRTTGPGTSSSGVAGGAGVGSSPDGPLHVAAGEVESMRLSLRQKEDQIAQLMKVAAERKDRIGQIEAKLAETLVEMERRQKAHLALREKLEKRPTLEAYHEVASRLRVLEKLEFGDAMPEDALVDPSAAAESTPRPSVEQLYHRRVKIQQDEITRLSNELEESRKHGKDRSEKLEDAEARQAEHIQLISKLENDLVRLQEEGHRYGAKTGPLDASGSEKGPDEVPGQDDSSGSAVAASGGAGVSPSSMMLSVVVEQRNRFRENAEKVEEANSKLRSRVSELDSRCSKLRDDNVKLYEKIRYIESYHGPDDPMSTTPQVDRIRRDASEIPGSESKYKAIYEERLSEEMTNPFRKFTRKERSEQWNKLSWAEKIIFRTTQAMMVRKSGRLFLFFYICALHLLVFFVCLYLLRR